jgi:hypothetical protein
MPRNANPSTLTPGAGLAPAGTVEDSSLRYPERDVDPLRAHLHDPVRAHMASAIGIVDAGGYYTSDDVEGALQELGGGSAANYAARQNGWVSAGTSAFTTAAVVGGATVTLSGSWVAITNTGLVDVSGLGITIAGAAGTYWVYLDSTTGLLAQLAAPAVPDITSDEDIPVGLFTFNGAAITGQRDGRFFVRNDNRKVTYTVRGDGSEEDANSEGAFATIEGAFTWIQAYTTGSGGVSQKSRLTLRGAFTITDTLTIPVGNLEIVGEDAAEITFTSGGATELFDIDAHTNIAFRDISFVCNSVGSVSAIDDLTGPTVGLTVDHCRFSGTGGNSWAFPISLANGFTDLVVSNCGFVVVDGGIRLDSPAAFDSLGATITNNTVNGAFLGGFGISGNVSRLTISGNRIDGYLGVGTEPTAVGISLSSNAGTSGEAPSDAVITGNVVYRCAFGINVEGQYDERADNDFTVAVIPANGDTITVTDASGVAYVLTARNTVTLADEFLIGGSVNATAANIITAINDTANTFYADVVHAASTGGAGVRFYAVPQGAVGNDFTLATSAPAAITIPSALFANGFDGSVQGVIISQNTVTNCAISSAGGGGFAYANTGAIGIGMNFTRDCRVVDNDVREIGILIDNTGTPIIPSITGPVENSAGITVWNSTRYAVERNSVLNTTGTSSNDQRGIYLVTGDQGVEITFTNEVVAASVSDNKIVWSLEGGFAATAGATYGSVGIQSITSIITGGADSASADYLISGMTICRNEVTNCGGAGIEAVAFERSLYQALTVDQNTIKNVGGDGIRTSINALTNTAGPSGFQGVSISGNSIVGVVVGSGILLEGTRAVASNKFVQFSIKNNRISDTESAGFALNVTSVDAAYMPNVSQIDVIGNEMILVGTGGATDSAISFTVSPTDDLTISAAFENIRVNGNSILDSGGDTAHAIEFALTNWEPLNVEVSGNTVSGSVANPSPGGGLRMNVASTNATPTNYGIASIEAVDNTFTLSGSLPVGTAQIVVTAPFVAAQTLRFYFPPTGAFVPLTAVAGAPATDEFQITGAVNTDAVAIRNALNNASNSFSDFLTASISTAGTVGLVADANMPGSMCGMTGPVQTGAAVTTITPFAGTGVGANERRATFQIIVNNNAALNPGDQLVVDLPGALLSTPLTFAAAAGLNQIVIGANAAVTAANIVTAINTYIPSDCSAAIYPDAAASGRIVLLTAGDDIPGRLGNYAQVSITTSSDAIYLGNDDGYFSFGEDDMINGVSIEADGVVVQANIQRNTVTYSGTNATRNRRPAFIRAKQATYPYSLDVPALGTLTVAAAGVPPVGVGDGQTFTIDDGSSPAITFEYVIPPGNPYNPANVPISFDVGAGLSEVTKKTAEAIQGVISAGRLRVNVVSADLGTGVISLAAIPQASVSGSITVSGLPLTTTSWVGGSVVADANPFSEAYGLNIEDNDFFGGIGSQVEILNGCVLRGLSFSGNRVGRPDVAVTACDPGVRYSGYYHGFSTFTRSGLITRAGLPLTGVDQLVGIVATGNDFSNLGHGAVSVYKDETKNNLFPFVIDTSITDNRAYNCGLSGVSPTMLALQTWGYSDLGTVASAVISGNNIENSVVLASLGRPLLTVYTAGSLSAHILVQPYITATDINVRGNTILGGSSTALVVDSVSQVASAISVFNGLGLFCRDFSITDNRIHGVSLAASSNVMPVTSHIFAGSPLWSAEGSSAAITGLDISRNMVVENSSPYEFWDSTTTALSINGAFPLVGGITVNGVLVVSAMSIDNNLVDVTRQTISIVGGPPPVYFNGHILVTSGVVGTTGGVLVAGSISGNQLNVSNDNAIGDFLKYTYGVFCQMSCSNVKVDANKVILLGSDTGGFFFGNGGALWGTFLLGSSVSNNSITASNNTPGGNQAFLGVYTNVGVSGSEFCNNTFASAYSSPFDGGIIANSAAPFFQTVVSGNSIVAALGVKVAGLISDSSFAANSVAGDSTPSAQGFWFVDTVTNTAISGNTVRYVTRGFQFDADVLGSSITGNGVRDAEEGFRFGNPSQVLATAISANSVSVSVSGFLFTNCTLNSLAITGNTVYGGGIGTDAAFGGTAAVPLTGTCTGNVGANLGGGSTWTIWAGTGPRVAIYLNLND